MTKTEMLENIDFVKTLAEEGRNAPLLGGWIGLWWGFLLIATLFVHYLALIGKGPLAIEMIGLAWVSFGIIGGIGSVVLGRRLQKQPGASSMINRVATALWTGNTILLFTYGISAGFSAGLGHISFEIMDTMMPLAFGLYGLTAFVLTRIGGARWQLIPALISLAFVPFSLFLLGKPELYLLAIVVVLCTIIIPDIIHIRNEPKAVK